MSKLWIFGDSYGVHVEQDPKAVNKWFWAYQLAQKLKCEYYDNRSQMGVANDYIQHMIMEAETEITPEDYVVVITTSTARKWFIQDKPWVSNFYINNLEEHTSPEFVSAVKQYMLHLYNPDTEIIKFHQLLGWIHYITDKNKWNLIVIPGFEEAGYPISHNYQVKGSLFDVCKNEFKSADDAGWYYNIHCKGRDKRSGHLLKVNHNVLVEKIFNAFTKNEPIDLNVGFAEGLISKNTIENLDDQFPILDLEGIDVKGFVPTL